MTYFISWRMKDIYCLIKDIMKGVQQEEICLAAFIYCRPGHLPPWSLSTLQVQFLHPFPDVPSLNVHSHSQSLEKYTLENKLWKSGHTFQKVSYQNTQFLLLLIRHKNRHMVISREPRVVS